MERQRRAQPVILVSSSSYFSNGTTSKQKKIAYVKNSNGERGQAVFVNKNGNQTRTKQTSNVQEIKRILGIGRGSKAPVASAQPAQKRGKRT